DVVTGSELANAGVVTTQTLNNAVPALFVSRSSGANTSFFIRGVGNFTNNAYSDPAVAFNYDNVYVARPTSTTTAFYDLERLEVLKGPQGTLYGRNATGGAINVIPVRPRLGEVAGYASAGYGSFKTLDLEAAINLPVGDNSAFRVSGKLVNGDGFNRDGTGDQEAAGVRAQFLTRISDDIRLRIGADYAYNGGMGVGPSYLGILRGTGGAPASATAPAGYTFVPEPSSLGPREGLHTDAAQAYHRTFLVSGSFNSPDGLDRPFLNNHQWGVNAELEIDTNVGSLTIIPAFRRTTLDLLFNGPGFKAGLNNETDTQYSLEARFEGKRVGPFDWLVGAFYFDENIDADFTVSQFVTQAIQQFNTGTNSSATWNSAGREKW
ncbi:MAG: TonB-dependent receptor plug domain-containing protein, partial [Sphingomonadales bacterium]